MFLYDDVPDFSCQFGSEFPCHPALFRMNMLWIMSGAGVALVRVPRVCCSGGGNFNVSTFHCVSTVCASQGVPTHFCIALVWLARLCPCAPATHTQQYGEDQCIERRLEEHPQRREARKEAGLDSPKFKGDHQVSEGDDETP